MSAGAKEASVYVVPYVSVYDAVLEVYKAVVVKVY